MLNSTCKSSGLDFANLVFHITCIIILNEYYSFAHDSILSIILNQEARILIFM